MAKFKHNRNDPPEESKNNFALGDKVRYKRESTAPDEGNKHGPKSVKQTARVMFIHPRGRFITVEYECHGYKLRESISPSLVKLVG